MSNLQTRISVIMAARDAAGTIEAAMNSVLRQGDESLELIVVNDSSTDATADVAASFSDRRVRILDAPSGVTGRSAARNFAVNHSRGQYLAISDADDIATGGNRFVVACNVLDNHPELDVFAGQIAEFGPWGGPKQRITLPTAPEAIKRRLRRGRMAIAHGTATFRREWFERLGGYDADLKRAEDFHLFLRGQNGNNYAASEMIFMHYRTEAKSPSVRNWLEDEHWSTMAISKARQAGVPIDAPAWDRPMRAAGFLRDWTLSRMQSNPRSLR